jgi:hypothetical protein
MAYTKAGKRQCGVLVALIGACVLACCLWGCVGARVPDSAGAAGANPWQGALVHDYEDEQGGLPGVQRVILVEPPVVFNASHARESTRENAADLLREWDTDDIEFAKLMQHVWEATLAGKYFTQYEYTYSCNEEEEEYCLVAHDDKVVGYLDRLFYLGFNVYVDTGLSVAVDSPFYTGYIVIDIDWQPAGV